MLRNEKEQLASTMRKWRYDKPRYIVDAINIHDWAITEERRQLIAIFAVMVAGKSAKRTSEVLNYMMHELPGEMPFDKIRNLVKRHDAEEVLKTFRTGQYKRTIAAFKEIHKLDVTKTVDPDKLLAIPGIGLKSSRFVALVCDRSLPLAVIDTHILKFLRIRLGMEVPRSTPTSKKLYNKLSEPVIKMTELLGVLPGDLDLALWRCGQRRGNFCDEEIAKELGLSPEKVAKAIECLKSP